MNAAFESKLHHIIGIVLNLEVKIGKCPAERIYYVDLLQYIVRLSLLLFTTAVCRMNPPMVLRSSHSCMDGFIRHTKFSSEKKEAWAREADGA